MIGLVCLAFECLGVAIVIGRLNHEARILGTPAYKLFEDGLK